MPRERFEGEEELLTAPVSPNELSEVLRDLSATEQEPHRDFLEDHVTAEAISEATGASLESVFDAIARVRRKDVREHVSKVLSELEEPTHRVERPGHPPNDPLVNHFGWRREQVFSQVLDKLGSEPKRQAATVNQRESQANNVIVALTIIILVALILIVALATVAIR